MIGPLLFSIIVAISVVLLFGAMWRLLTPDTSVDERLAEYGGILDIPTLQAMNNFGNPRRQRFPMASRLLLRMDFGPRLANLLMQADVPLTAAEFMVFILAGAFIGIAFGILKSDIFLGVLLGIVFVVVPFFYLNWRKKRRQSMITEQLPDVLALLVGALRAGYGLAQAFEVALEQIPAPFSMEIDKVLRSVNLGQSMQQALNNMAERVATDDMDMVIVAINIQYETGGNLAQTMETIAETIRERLRIKQEIQVLTAQQRLTGYLLTAMPIILAFILFLINPDYMSRLVEPGWIRLVPIVAAIMQIIGFLAMRKIVNIEV
jgi:tight adherence protein B